MFDTGGQTISHTQNNSDKHSVCTDILFFVSFCFFKYLFIFGCAESLLLCMGLLGGYIRVAVCGLLTAVASLAVEHGQ